MKFISKSANLNIMLRPGLPAQPITGTPATPAISVRFQNGLAVTDDEKIINMMLAHPGFTRDFVSADENGVDPYAGFRQEAEPQHVTTDIKHGTPVGRTVSKGKPQLPPEIMKLVQEQAASIARELLPGMVAETLKTLVKANAEVKTEQAKARGKVSATKEVDTE